jgi:hypothetical protein
VTEKQAKGEPKPRCRPGPPKGTPNVPGSGRKKGTVNWTSQEVRERLLPAATQKIMAIIEGEPMLCSGPTGKQIRRRPTLDQQLKAAELAYRKCLADLQSTTLQGPGETPLIPREEHSPRDLARAVLGILHKAEIDERA